MQLNYISLLLESLLNIAAVGLNLITLKPAQVIQVQAGDVIGWVHNSSSGELSFEQTVNDPSFFYPNSKFNTSPGTKLNTSVDVCRHEIKHLLRAHVSQPSVAAVNINFTSAGIYKVNASVKNSAKSVNADCLVSVQV